MRKERRVEERREAINHPAHYGGDWTYEPIKVIRAWGLNFSLGSVLKYIYRRDKKHDEQIEDLKKAIWYLQEELAALQCPTCADCGKQMRPNGGAFICDNCGSTSGCS